MCGPPGAVCIVSCSEPPKSSTPHSSIIFISPPSWLTTQFPMVDPLSTSLSLKPRQSRYAIPTYFVAPITHDQEPTQCKPTIQSTLDSAGRKVNLIHVYDRRCGLPYADEQSTVFSRRFQCLPLTSTGSACMLGKRRSLIQSQAEFAMEMLDGVLDQSSRWHELTYAIPTEGR